MVGFNYNEFRLVLDLIFMGRLIVLDNARPKFSQNAFNFGQTIYVFNI